MANYNSLKNAALIAPTTTPDLGSDTNRYGNVYMSGNINMSGTSITSTNVITPKVTSIVYVGEDDTAADIAGGQTITLNGTGFASGASVLIAGTVVSVVSFVSSTQLTLVTPVLAAGSYVLYVVNPDGGTAISIPGIQYSGTPAWSTAAGTLGSAALNTSVNITLAATGDAPVTYSVFSGTLPPGVTLNSATGFLSGTTPTVSVETTYNFVIRATDLQNQDTNRSFSFTVTVYVGKLYSWGANGFGQLGLTNTSPNSSPNQVGTLTNWLSIGAGQYHGVAIKTDGTLWSWGSNYVGRLGLGNTTNYSSPKQIGALTTWSTVSVGNYHNLAIKTDGTLWGWGFNHYTDGAALGLGDISSRSSPTQIGSLTTWASVAAGKGLHSVAIKTDGTLWSWGGNYSGKLGLGFPTATSSTSSPQQVGTLTNWSKVFAGGSYSVAIKTDGTLWSWGQNAYNSEGCLGLGNTINRSSPNQVGGDNQWLSIAAGGGHVLGISTYGLYAWGKGQYGRLGLGDTTARLNPTQISGLTWSKISAGDAHCLAIRADGTLWAWGSNEFGRLGLGNTTYKSSPTQIGALTTWSSIAGGTHNSLAISG